MTVGDVEPLIEHVLAHARVLLPTKPAAAAAWLSGPAGLYRANRARPVTVPIRVPVSLSAAVLAPLPVSVPMSRSPPMPFWSAPN